MIHELLRTRSAWLPLLSLLVVLCSTVLVQGTDPVVWSGPDPERFCDSDSFMRQVVGGRREAARLLGVLLEESGAPALVCSHPFDLIRLVDAFLRSHELAPCGHRDVHDTAGTPCSFSRGTPVGRLFDALVARLLDEGRVDCSTAFVLCGDSLEKSYEVRGYFVDGDRLVPARVKVTPAEIVEARARLVREGFQTASFWSDERIREIVHRRYKGVRKAELERRLDLDAFVVRRDICNTLLRPIHLFLHCGAGGYPPQLHGLRRYVMENLAPSGPKDGRGGSVAAATRAARTTVTSAPEPPLSLAGTVHEGPDPAGSPAHGGGGGRSGESSPPRGDGEGRTRGRFAVAYGGTRFLLGWGR